MQRRELLSKLALLPVGLVAATQDQTQPVEVTITVDFDAKAIASAILPLLPAMLPKRERRSS